MGFELVWIICAAINRYIYTITDRRVFCMCAVHTHTQKKTYIVGRDLHLLVIKSNCTDCNIRISKVTKPKKNNNHIFCCCCCCLKWEAKRMSSRRVEEKINRKKTVFIHIIKYINLSVCVCVCERTLWLILQQKHINNII